MYDDIRRDLIFSTHRWCMWEREGSIQYHHRVPFDEFTLHGVILTENNIVKSLVFTSKSIFIFFGQEEGGGGGGGKVGIHYKSATAL